MGEVYRARDTRLHRDVAIKILPEHVAHEPDRLARFEREAHALAALNHPNIAQIYGIEESGQTHALVMELVPGRTLEELVSAGLAVEEAIAIARQIADALETAHDAGIVHRDLKPANVKVRDDGQVKVLDFGLAKGVEDDTAALDAVATRTSPAMTQAGFIIGTAAYMSPEQAKGKPVDRRADIWAFGVVLVEMLSGRRVFDADSIPETLAHVMTREVDLTTLPADTPRRVRDLIARCLVKDPRKRLRDIGEARLILENASESEAAALAPAAAAPQSSAVRYVWGAAGLVAGAATVWVLAARRETPPVAAPALVRSQVALRADGAPVSYPRISPDGRTVAYVANNQLWLQRLDEWESRALNGTENATRPFWSPHSDWIGFIANGRVQKIPVSGGPPVALGNFTFSSSGAGGAVWRSDGTIVLGTGEGGAPSSLFILPSSAAGKPTRIPRPADVSDYHEPALIPGRSEVLVIIHGSPDPGGIGYLRGDTVTKIMSAGQVRSVAYSPSGHIVFEREGENAGIWAVPFSADRLETIGEPVFVARGAWPSTSDNGTLAYRVPAATGPLQLAPVSFTGVVEKPIASPQNWRAGLAISSDGASMAASDNAGIWIYDVATGSRRRVTRNGNDSSPMFVAGNRIVFVRDQTVMIAAAGGSGAERVLVERARRPMPFDGGRKVAINQRGSRGWEPAWIDLEKPEMIHRFGDAHNGARFPEVSPDGRYMLYVSGEMGDDQLWVTRFPSGEGKWQLTTRGAGWAMWSPKGGEILFRDPSAGRATLSSIAVGSGPQPVFSAPRPLFDLDETWTQYYAIFPDRSRIVMGVPAQKVTAMPGVRIEQNWARTLAGR